jgi:nitrogen fixation protein NifQ
MDAPIVTRSLLLICAPHPDDPATLALARVLADGFDAHGRHLLPLPGLDGPTTQRLMAHWFPQADQLLDLDWVALASAHRPEARLDEIDDVGSLLRDNAGHPSASAEQVAAVAHALACACLGNNHLWQDLGLPSRAALSALINTWFPVLAERNDKNMKWKKFFYKQLCLREELFICKAPTCGVCTDYAVCFGPEDASTATITLHPTAP